MSDGTYVMPVTKPAQASRLEDRQSYMQAVISYTIIQANRHSHIQIERQTGRHRCMQTYTHTGMQFIYRQVCSHAVMESYRHTGKQTYRQAVIQASR